MGRLPWNVKIFQRYAHGRGVATYLAQYLRGGPIGNKRLLAAENNQVRFRYRQPSNQAGGRCRQGVMSLSVSEFLRRFLEHVPPRSLQTVRCYGLYAGNQHAQLPLAFEALGASPPQPEQFDLNVARWLEQLGHAPSGNQCPVCGRELRITERYYCRKSARSPPSPADTPKPKTILA